MFLLGQTAQTKVAVIVYDEIWCNSADNEPITDIYTLDDIITVIWLIENSNLEIPPLKSQQQQTTCY